MIRLLNILQGGFGFVIVLGVLTGSPLWLVGACLFLDVFVAIIIAVPLREESPKGRVREFVELCISFLGGLGGLLYLIIDENYSLNSILPTWVALVGIILMLINFGSYVGSLLRIISLVINRAAEFLEFCSGESFGRNG